jgi:hypothetical protein
MNKILFTIFTLYKPHRDLWFYPSPPQKKVWGERNLRLSLWTGQGFCFYLILLVHNELGMGGSRQHPGFWSWFGDDQEEKRKEGVLRDWWQPAMVEEASAIPSNVEWAKMTLSHTPPPEGGTSFSLCLRPLLESRAGSPSGLGFWCLLSLLTIVLLILSALQIT